jgi:hypothetical protein
MSGLGERILKAGTGQQQPTQTSAEKLIPEVARVPEGTAQKLGFATEKAAEYFIPAGSATKAEKALDLISIGIKSPLVAAGARILGKAGIQGATAGGVNLLQTGGNLEEAKKTALTAGAIRGGMAIIGEGARALKIPERLYQTVFKNSKQDMINELRSEKLTELMKNDPVKFNDFVDKGIIKIGANNNPVLNDTLAEQALNKGLKGSVRSMAKEVVDGTLDSEDKVMTIAKQYKGKINLSEKQIKNVLNTIADDYKDVGLGEVSQEAKGLVRKINIGRGEINAVDALNIRRLLDRVRIASSFDKPITNLSQTQGNLKTLSDIVRRRVNDVPGMSGTMKDYSFYIEALETLANEAKKRGNEQVLSLIDSLFLSGAGSNPAVNLSFLAGRRALKSATGATMLGSAIKKGVVSPFTQGLISSTAQKFSSVFPPK